MSHEAGTQLQYWAEYNETSVQFVYTGIEQ